MQLTGVDGNALTSAGLVQDPVEELRRSATLAHATCGNRGLSWRAAAVYVARIQINQNSFDRTLGPWVVAVPGCLQRCSDTATSEAFVLLATSASPGPTDLEPINAIAISPVAKIAPTMAFALSHRSTVRRSSGDSLL
jgi:hypothetical protein